MYDSDLTAARSLLRDHPEARCLTHEPTQQTVSPGWTYGPPVRSPPCERGGGRSLYWAIAAMRSPAIIHLPFPLPNPPPLPRGRQPFELHGYLISDIEISDIGAENCHRIPEYSLYFANRLQLSRSWLRHLRCSNEHQVRSQPRRGT